MSECTKYKVKEECNRDPNCKFTEGNKRKFCRTKRNTKRNERVKTKKAKKENPATMNENLADVLEELASGEQAFGKVFQAKAYKNAAEQILAHEPIRDINQIKSIKGVGKKIFDKLSIYVQTGTFPLLEKIRNNPRLTLYNVYGIGAKKAEELVKKHGITSISQLKERQDLLNNKQKMGLEYYDDLQKRIPRGEIKKHETFLRKTIPKNSGLTMEIVGSYRRGAKTSGDIDVIFTHSNTQEGLRKFQEFIGILKEKRYITHILAKGKKKAMFIGKIKGGKAHRRIDFLFAEKEKYPFTTLYFTGSKYFNIYMRLYALERDISLSEHGMKNIRTNEIINIPQIQTERDIFDYLGLEYVEPKDRKGRGSIRQISN
jgi:DNA polymerase/3'-5' exonuclease PolX